MPAKKKSVVRVEKRAAPRSSSSPPPAPAPPPSTPSPGLLRLEPAFDVDELSRQLGESHLRFEVPKAELAETLKRVLEFMDFGVYVYSVVLLPAPGKTLERFVLQLDRIEYDERRGVWIPFREKGVADDPFGSRPGTGRGSDQ